MWLNFELAVPVFSLSPLFSFLFVCLPFAFCLEVATGVEANSILSLLGLDEPAARDSAGISFSLSSFSTLHSLSLCPSSASHSIYFMFFIFHSFYSYEYKYTWVSILIVSPKQVGGCYLSHIRLIFPEVFITGTLAHGLL